jgi:proteasome lid subunit RPN8/RPN11
VSEGSGIGVTMRAPACEAIVAHARQAAPAECCGLFLGRREEILEAVPARNLADDPSIRFLIDPADHFAARRAARIRGLEVVGFYHSHPAARAEPSERDRREFCYAGHLYAIVSLQVEPVEVGLYRFETGNFHRVPFVTVA